MSVKRAVRRVSMWAFICAWLVVLCPPQAAFALPEGRHYEMVSPTYKGGYGVNQLIGAAMPVGGGETAGEGDFIAFNSYGAFNNADNAFLFTDYLAHRESALWSTEAFSPPATVWPGEDRVDVNPALNRSLYQVGAEGLSKGAAGYESPPEFVVQGQSVSGVEWDFATVPLKRIDGKLLELSHASARSSEDFCHIVFPLALEGTAEQLQEALLPAALGTQSLLYELESGAPGCGGKALRLVAVENESGIKEPQPLDPYCLAFTGSPPESSGSLLNAMSTDGKTVFFETNLNLTKPGCDGESLEPQDPAVLFARLEGKKTVEISTPIKADCKETTPSKEAAPCYDAIKENAAFKAFAGQQRAVFDGANKAGTRVFFTTAQPLVTEDSEVRCEERPGGVEGFGTLSNCLSGQEETQYGKVKRFGNDVYMAELGCPEAKGSCLAAEREVTSLVQVSHSPHGEASEVQNALVISPDGERVYYVGRGVVTEEVGPEGAHAVKGADNLYVYDAGEKVTKFIAELCSGSEMSGEVKDSHCPASEEATDATLWEKNSKLGEARELQAAGRHGEFLAFVSYGRLASGDTDNMKDVYLYDALTGVLTRVSTGEGGYDANGNNELFGAELPKLTQSGQMSGDYELNYRAVSEDGSRVVFETSEPLSPGAVNGLTNIYEWHAGRVALLSSGTGEESVGQQETVAMTPSGKDIFFITNQSLVEQDTDEAKDVYDAREGEGFPASQAVHRPCSGEACQGPLTNPAPLLVPGSVSQAAGENVIRPLPKTKNHKPRRRLKQRRGRHRRRKRPGRKLAQARHAHRARITTMTLGRAR